MSETTGSEIELLRDYLLRILSELEADKARESGGSHSEDIAADICSYIRQQLDTGRWDW